MASLLVSGEAADADAHDADEAEEYNYPCHRSDNDVGQEWVVIKEGY